jgi:glycyl-tRNA synthetase beta chain
VGLIPTGTADPYGLRRQTLGILSILESKGLRIPLSELVDRSLATLGGKLKSPAGEVKRKVMEFITGRLSNLWTTQGIAGDLVDAILSAGLTDMVDMRAKLSALVTFRQEAAFEPLVFEHEEEHTLHKAIRDVSDGVHSAAMSGRYSDAFREMARLQPLVSAFFGKVLVMAKEEKVKNNRLALLKGLSDLFASVADFSRVTVGQQK